MSSDASVPPRAMESRSGNSALTAGSVRTVTERIEGAAVGTGVLAARGRRGYRESTAITGRRGSGEAGKRGRNLLISVQ
jgi:hypothetical protein